MGRKTIEPSEKKTLIRVFVKQKVINAFTKEEMQELIFGFTNHLQTHSLKKCAEEVLKKEKK